jgi:hypothetical protein
MSCSAGNSPSCLQTVTACLLKLQALGIVDHVPVTLLHDLLSIL